jgi:hypothetical protein
MPEEVDHKGHFFVPTSVGNQKCDKYDRNYDAAIKPGHKRKNKELSRSLRTKMSVQQCCLVVLTVSLLACLCPLVASQITCTSPTGRFVTLIFFFFF